MNTETKNGDAEIVRSFIVQERVLRLIGIWPLNTNSFVSSSIGRWFFAIMTQVSVVAPSLPDGDVSVAYARLRELLEGVKRSIALYRIRFFKY